MNYRKSPRNREQVDDFHEDASTETLEYSFLCNWNIKLVVLCFWQI